MILFLVPASKEKQLNQIFGPCFTKIQSLRSFARDNKAQVMCVVTFSSNKKRNKSCKIVRFRQGFEKRFMTSSREFSFFFCFFVHLFWPFYPGVLLFSRSVHGQQQRAFFWHKIIFRKKYWNLILVSMGCIVSAIGNDLESDSQTLSTKIWRKYYPGKKIKEGQTEPRETSEDRRMIAISEF